MYFLTWYITYVYIDVKPQVIIFICKNSRKFKKIGIMLKRNDRLSWKSRNPHILACRKCMPNFSQLGDMNISAV